MSGLVLMLRAAEPLPDDLRAIRPLALAGLDPLEAARRPLGDATAGPRIGDLFDVATDARSAPDRLTVVTGALRPDFLGRELDGGTLHIVGDAGAGLGHGMRAGTIEVSGNCGDYVASAMRGGLIRVVGDAGDHAGGALHGERHGMAGGVVAIHGRAGARAGDRMRRGLMLIGQRCGEACAAGMLAGTIVTPECDGTPAIGLRRGSLVLLRRPAALPPTFNDSGPVDLAWLRLLARAAAPWLPGLLPPGGRGRRYCGDLACGGKGEILVLAE